MGYDEFGKASYLKYIRITKIKVNDRVYTIDQLQDFMSGEGDGSAEDKEKKGGGGDESPAAEDEEGADAKKEPDLSWYSPVYDIGKQILKEAGRKYDDHHKKKK